MPTGLTPQKIEMTLAMVFLYKALFGYVNVDVSNYVLFVSHGLTRRVTPQSTFYKVKFVEHASTFQSSYYNRVIKVWNIVCKDVCMFGHCV